MSGFDVETLPHATRIPGAPKILLPRVLVAWSDAAGRHEIAIEGSALVGSSPSVALRIDDPLVSRLHAEISARPDGVWLRDLSSKNGSFVEGVRVVEALVASGARVRLGSTVFTFTESWDGAPPEASPPDTTQLGALLGRSQAMRELFARIIRLGATSVPVLLCGETGVGKELVARTIHERSDHASAPFVAVDCATLTGPELDAALASPQATVFFDEVADLSPGLQAFLLRALDSSASSGLRFVAATQRDLPRLVSEGGFREDLFFRLAVLPVTVPPLRDRLDDVPLLVEAFLPSSEHAAITPALLADLRARPWRGNVRELKNFVERALAFGTDEAVEMLPPPSTPGAKPPLPSVAFDEPFKVVRDRWVSHLEREYMRGMLARTGGNVSAAADAAGLDRAYVYRLMKKHGL